MIDDLSFLDNLTILSPEERAQIEKDRDPVLADAKDWAENATMPPDRRGLLRLLIGRVEHAEQVSRDALGVSKAIVRTVAQVKRIQQEFADDLIDDNGSIYEQVKDLVEQFYAERDTKGASEQRWEDLKMLAQKVLDGHDCDLTASAAEELLSTMTRLERGES